MIVVPCSMRSLAAMADGLGVNLLTRAADVLSKEKAPAGGGAARGATARRPPRSQVAAGPTSHPDFDDTPLSDENGDGDPANDGDVWHGHGCSRP
jgi:hypothetical protein